MFVTIKNWKEPRSLPVPLAYQACGPPSGLRTFLRTSDRGERGLY